MTVEGKRALAALFAGGVFGVGLAVSGMTNPEKIFGFLDVLGHWDPSLILVMAGALAVTAVGFRLFGSAPLLDVKFHMPSKTSLDGRLIAGAALFGIGWGVAGFCPGPAVASLGSGAWYVYVFITALLLGGFLADRLVRWLDRKNPA